MKIKKLTIEKFRHMEDVEIEFGDRLTVISGQNGTGKSTILGMVGQVFDYKGKERTKNNREFATKYSEIFRFSDKDDKPGQHSYEAEIEKDGQIKCRRVNSRLTVDDKGDKRFRLDVGDRHAIKIGTMDHPVIYLGLKRLFPLAQEKEDSIKVNPHKLSDNEAKRYSELASEILVSRPNIEPESIKSPNKESFAMKTPQYSHLGNSAGQDNLGQIISAILSFEELKSVRGDKYKGGILLIDELDATLYAGSQIQLLKVLDRVARECNLQIIFTSHSLEVLDHLESRKDQGYKVNFLKTRDNRVSNHTDYRMSDIRSEILIETKQEDKLPPMYVLCEDEVAVYWCKSLLNSSPIKNKLGNRLQIGTLPCSSGVLKDFATTKHFLFRGVVFVLDADCEGSETYKKCPRTVFLPGKYAPEKELYEFLYNLKDGDQFWNNAAKFTQQVCFRDFTGKDHPGYKKWFDRNRGNFGNGLSGVLNRWKQDNKESVQEFQKKFEKKVMEAEKKI